MISLRTMTIGSGYRYLMESVAAGDGERRKLTSLTDYYAKSGTPPGVFLGAVVDRGIQLEVSDHGSVIADDPDVEVRHQDQDAFALKRSSHSDVVELGSIAQGEAARLVDSVSADPGVGIADTSCPRKCTAQRQLRSDG